MTRKTGRCRICGCYGEMDVHHMLHGSYKKLADEDDLTCLLCRDCHRALHDKGSHDLELQKEAELIWLKREGKTIDDFISRYGKNWLWGEDDVPEEGQDTDHD